MAELPPTPKPRTIKAPPVPKPRTKISNASSVSSPEIEKDDEMKLKFPTELKPIPIILTNGNVSTNDQNIKKESNYGKIIPIQKKKEEKEENNSLTLRNHETDVRRITNSLLLNFDPILEGMFTDEEQSNNNKKYSDSLKDLFSTIEQAPPPILPARNHSEIPSRLPDKPSTPPQIPLRLDEKPKELPPKSLRLQDKPSEIPQIPFKNEDNVSELPQKPLRLAGKPFELPLIPSRLEDKIPEAPQIPLRLHEKPFDLPLIQSRLDDKTLEAPQVPLRLQEKPFELPLIPSRPPEGAQAKSVEVSDLAPPELPLRPRAKVRDNETPERMPVLFRRHEYDSVYEPPTVPERPNIRRTQVTYSSEDIELLPPPPIRLDSLPREDLSKISTSVEGVSPSPIFLAAENIKGKKSYVMKNLSKLLPKQQSLDTSVQQHFKRPQFGLMNSKVIHTGTLIQTNRDKSEWKASIAAGILRWSNDKMEGDIKLFDVISISAFTSDALQNSSPLHCIEIAWSKPGQATQVSVFGASNEQSRSEWMQKLLDATCSDIFPFHTTHGYILTGWVHIKEGISGVWVSCWMLLKERTLYYCSQPHKLLESDLRKARCINHQNFGGIDGKSDCVLVELQGKALYIQAQSLKDTNRWGFNIKNSALNNGTDLEQHQLTKDDIPVIVSKCINFISQEGSLSEGIYRKNGSLRVVKALLADFHKDAWSVQLIRNEYSEHDVATALKRFFQKLPNPIIPIDLTRKVCKVAAGREVALDKRAAKYQHYLKQLSNIAYLTLRKLFGHLYFLHLQANKNLMNASNLASLWGITLMHGTLEDFQDHQALFTQDVISMFPRIFNATEAEIAHEQQVIRLLEKYHEISLPTNQQQSGDIKVWIQIGKYGSADTVQVTVSPQKTAGEICNEIDRGKDFVLQEFVLNGALHRPIHHGEKIFDVIIRWGYWDDADRKDNVLVLAPSKVHQEIIQRIARPPLAACSELKFADAKTKNFKISVLELSQAKLNCYKDRKLAKGIEWKIEEIIWYLGFEPKRDPGTTCSITFIPRTDKVKRSKESPYFGNTIASSNQDEMMHWCAALYLAEHSDQSLEYKF